MFGIMLVLQTTFLFYPTIHVTRFPENPMNGRGEDVDMVDLTCELAKVAFIALASIIISKENRLNTIKTTIKKKQNRLKSFFILFSNQIKEYEKDTCK